MNTVNISQKAKNKHLNFSHYEFIINSLIQFNASHPGKRNTGKTQFIKELASTVGTTVSNIYSMISDFIGIKTIRFKQGFNGHRRIFLEGFIDEIRTKINSFS